MVYGFVYGFVLQGITCSKTFINTATENIVNNVNLICYQQNLNVTEHLTNVLVVKVTDEQKDENENETEQDKAKLTRIKISLI